MYDTRLERVNIVVPTYNECKNVPILLDLIVENFEKGRNLQYEILVVDDFSPDGTADIVLDYIKKHDNVSLILRKRLKTMGTNQAGAALKEGYKHILRFEDSDAVVQLDADLSHSPKYIERLVDELEKGADLAIASRYVKEGGASDWSIMRKVLSLGANLLQRVSLGLYQVHDCTSGFRATKTSLLRKMNLSCLDDKGPNFQIGFLVEAVTQGAKVKEIPIIFRKRERGKSTIGFFEILWVLHLIIDSSILRFKAKKNTKS